MALDAQDEMDMRQQSYNLCFITNSVSFTTNSGSYRRTNTNVLVKAHISVVFFYILHDDTSDCVHNCTCVCERCLKAGVGHP